ncbi:MAG TPA: trehalase family glycosidase [Ferruginibacter sp.]|nr:trehalase family glycosidase [Ferruginibacter sp.]
MYSRRIFIQGVAITTAGALLAPSLKAFAGDNDWYVPVGLQEEMYNAALAITQKKVRGGPGEPYFKKPFLDAAFSGNIFLWDTCFIASYAKYHKGLPIANALDNFYNLQEEDGFICREYTREGKAMWPKDHPVSINPPLLAFAELELYSQSKNKKRLQKVYPSLKRFFDFLISRYRMEDMLFFHDAFGSGMDNIPRYPHGWKDDGEGIAVNNLFPDIFKYDELSSKWNRQGRAVDFSAQMALFADHLITIGRIINEKKDVASFQQVYNETKGAINKYCWDEEDGFYYDLGYGKQIKRKHIGMFWVLLAGIVPKNKLSKVLAHLTDKNQFWRKFPVASFPADQTGFSGVGEYWLGSVWAPTNYMILKGLVKYDQKQLATKLARQYYWCIAEVFKTTKTFWENYAPDYIKQGNNSRGDFCGWTAIAPIALYHEFIHTK